MTFVDGIFVVNPDDLILFWSRAAEALFGYGMDDALRLVAAALFLEWPPKWPLITAKRKDGTTFLAEVTVEPLASAMQLITVRDLWRDESLSTLENVGLLERDLVDGGQRWSEELFHMYGFPPAPHPPAVDDVLARIVESDRPRVIAMYEEAIRTQQPQRVEYRVRRDGELRTLQAAVKTVADQTGHPIRLYGSVRDVTGAGDDRTRRLAHEFNNVMMGMQTFVEVLKRRKDADTVDRVVEGMESSIKRGKSLADDLLRHTRR